MTEQALMVVNQVFHGSNSKSLASRFNAGRFDKDMKWAAERSFAEQAIRNNEKLRGCTTESIQSAMLDVAYSGLSLSPTMAHGYLIPYGKLCSFAPGYRGLLHMAYKAGTIKSVQVNLVYQNDPTFKVWTDEHGRHLQHEENARGNRGEVTHAYCIANLVAGGPAMIEVMSRTELNAVENQAKRKGGGMVWSTPWKSEMQKKAVTRRASKYWPKDNAGVLQHMMEVSDRHDGVEFAPSPDATLPDAELCINTDQYTELHDLLLARGITPEVAPEWLRRWAQSKGYASIEDTPARLFDEAKDTLTKRLDERSATTQNRPDA